MAEETELQREKPGPFFRPYWGEPRYLCDGDAVWLPLSHDDVTGHTKALRCTALIVAGDYARIVCPGRGVDRWARLSTLLVPPDSPRHWNQASP